MANGHGDTIKVFLIDDDQDHLSLLSSTLKDSPDVERPSCKFEVQCFADPTSAMAALPPEGPTAIVCDYDMPGATALDWLPDLLKKNVGPVLLVTGHGDEKVATEAFKAGASDYLIKFQVMEHPESLRRAIREAIRRYTLEKHELSLTRQLKSSNSELEAKHANLRQLTYSMTHDLQTPLAGLTGAVDALRNHLGPQADETTNRWLSRVDVAANRMVAMLDDLMVFAKAGSEELKCAPVNLQDALRNVIDEVSPMAAERNIEIQCSPSVFTVNAELNALQRVLMNLIGNAVKYIERETGGLIQVAADQHEEHVVISVTDNGPGIATNQLERVFLPFKRANSKKPGTGLGLSIARQYVEAFGGRIWLESDGINGATAHLELLAASPASKRRVSTT